MMQSWTQRVDGMWWWLFSSRRLEVPLGALPRTKPRARCESPWVFASPVGLPFLARPVGAKISAAVYLGSGRSFLDNPFHVGRGERKKYKIENDSWRWRAALLLLLLLTYVRPYVLL